MFLNSAGEGSLVRIANGTSESTRIGRKLTIRSISWRFVINLPELDAGATPGPGDTLRLMLVLDKQANGVLPGVQDIWEAADFQSFNNLANSQRFKTLMDRTYNLNYLSLASDGVGVVSQATVDRSDSFFKTCNITIQYTDNFTTGAISTVRSNNLVMLAASANGVIGIRGKMRMRFSDD